MKKLVLMILIKPFKPVVVGALSMIALAAPLAVPQTHALASTQTSARGATSGNCNQPMSDPITRVSGVGRFFASTRDGCWIFARESAGSSGPNRNAIVVFRRNSGAVTRVTSVPVDDLTSSMLLTHDEKLLVVKSQTRAAFLDVGKLMSGQASPIMGYIGDNHWDINGEMFVTADDKRLLVRQSGTAWITVIDLEKARARGFGPDAIVGGVDTKTAGNASFTPSPDGRYLFLTNGAWMNNPPAACNSSALGVTRSAPARGNGGNERALTVIDVQKAISAPAEALVVEVHLGCHAPAVYAISPDGNTIYGALVDEPALVVFDVRPVRQGQQPTWIATVPLNVPLGNGGSPRAIALVDGGKKLVVTQSPSDLVVIDTTRVTAGRDAILGMIPTGETVRDVGVMADGHTLLSTNAIIDLERVKYQPASQAGTTAPANGGDSGRGRGRGQPASEAARGGFGLRGTGFLGRGAASRIAVVDRQGKMTIVPDTTVQLSLVSISPDGAQVSIARNQVIEAIDLTTGKTMRISIRPSEYPAWSPDGKRIAYVSQGDSSLYVRSADGTGPEERYSQQIGSPLMWPSDDFLTIQVRQDTMALTVDSKRQLVPILSLTNVRAPRFSRDGRLVAYTTADGDVYVRPFNLARAEQWTEPPIKISTQRAAPEFNRWRADGRETYYLSADGWIMAVEITTTPALKAGLPRPLFRVPAGFDMNGLVGANSDASPDGQRFVFLVSQ